MIEERVNYILNDAKCEIALNEFSSYYPANDWIWKYMKLYSTITIHPDGLPPIANCNYQGEYFEFISKFHSLYSASLERMDDPF